MTRDHDDVSSEETRRKLLGKLGLLGVGAMAGCLGGNGSGSKTGGNGSGSKTGGNGSGSKTGGNGSGTANGGQFQSMLKTVDFAKNWHKRRIDSKNDWPLKVRQQVPKPDQQGNPAQWLKSTANKKGPWTPPTNWKDVIDDNVDSLSIINAGGLNGDPATAATYAAFQRETGIKMNVQETPPDEQSTKELQVLTNHDGKPQLFQTNTPRVLLSLVEAGFLEPVDPVMKGMWKPYAKIAKGAFTSDLGPTNGTHLYGSPGIRWNTIMHIRKDLLMQQGIDPKRFAGEYTWADLEAVMKAFKGTGVHGYAYAGARSHYSVAPFKGFVYQQGENLTKDDGKVVVNDKVGVTALQKMVEWRKKGWVPESVTALKEGDMNDLFVNGKIAMHASKSAQVTSGIQSGLTPGKDYIVALPPKATTGPDPRQSAMGQIANIAINRFADPAEKLASALYMDCRWSYESQWYEYVVEQNASFLNPVFNDAQKHDSVPFATTRRKLSSHATNDYLPHGIKIEERLGNAIGSAVAGNGNAKKLLNDVQKVIDNELDQ